MANLRLRLAVTQFIEYFIWGSWLNSLSGYLHSSMRLTNVEIGSVHAMMGIASMITPPIFGIVADKWINSERLLGICRLIGSISLYFAFRATSYNQLWLPMMINALTHMPALSLNFSMCYNLLDKSGWNVIKTFPPIRLWGSFGFIGAMWTINLFGWTQSSYQLLVASIASLISSIYVFTLPPFSPTQSCRENIWKAFYRSIVSSLFLLREKKISVFFIFSVLLGICLQINNTWSIPFLEDFSPIYPKSLAVKYPLILLSVSQISETLFILTVPFFLKKYGIKKSILLSCSAYAFRFGLFAIGNPQSKFVCLFLSMIMYGIAFDFFYISGSLFIEKWAPASIRSGAQGLLITATNGLGAITGQFIAAHIVNYFSSNEITNWQSIWWTITAYSFVIGTGFIAAFKE